MTGSLEADVNSRCKMGLRANEGETLWSITTLAGGCAGPERQSVPPISGED